jgi:cytochrome c553
MKKIVIMLLLLWFGRAQAVGDVTAGQVKAVVCAACHGVAGVSNLPIWPSLAGQHAAYLAKQLRDYQQDKLRHAEVMRPFAAPLSEQDRQDLAAFYASLAPPTPSAPTRTQARGKQLYRQGDLKQRITACIACHGPQGLGNGEAGFPRVAAQQVDYTRAQLYAFKHKQRQNDLNAIMRTISAHLSDEDITAVAEYMASMRE